MWLKSPTGVETFLIAISRLKMEQKFFTTLVQLLKTKWHFKHEDIVLILQRLKNPESEVVLYETATTRLDYLEFDENYNLARKCTWALSDIGSDRSKEFLERLSGNENTVIAAYAKKRLDCWDQEQNRKRIKFKK